MRIVTIKAHEIDDAVEKIWDSEEYLDDPRYLIRNADKLGADAILVYSPALRITDYGLIAAEGDYCVPDDSGDLLPDWSLTLIYNDAPDHELNLDDYVYYESSGIGASVHNFLNILSRSERSGYDLNKERRRSLAEIVGRLRVINSELDAIVSAEQDSLDNTPENMVDGYKYQEREETLEHLEEVVEEFGEVVDKIAETF